MSETDVSKKWIQAGIAGLAALCTASPGFGLELPPLTGEISGEVTLTQPAGAPTLHWKLGVVAGAAGDQRGEGAVTGIDLKLGATMRREGAGPVSWKITEGGVGLKTWSGGILKAGNAEISGGGTIDGANVSGAVRLQLSHLDINELILLVDAKHAYVTRATGEAGGYADIVLSATTPGVAKVVLALASGTMALVYFHPTPGLLTASLPPQVVKLYPGLVAIEEGRTPLQANVLEFFYQPQPDAEGRTARLHLEGRPLDPKLVAPLDVNFNISGPFEALIKKALDTRLHFGGG